MGHAELTIQDQAATKRISLDEYWMPFTPNREFKADPQMVVRAEGMYLWNDRGDKIIDASSGLFCVSAGHGRKEIAEAVGKQLRELDFCAPFLRAHPKTVRARDARRRAHAGRPQPDLLRQLRLRVRRHGDEGRARLPPGARPGRTQRLRLARARVPRRQLRWRVAVGARQQPAQVRPRTARASRTCGTRISRRTSSRRAKARTASELAEDLVRIVNLYGAENIAACFVEPIAGSTGCLVPPKGYLEAPARDLRRARHPARVRRGDHGLRPHGPDVRRAELRRHAGHHDDGEGDHQRRATDGRGGDQRAHPRHDHGRRARRRDRVLPRLHLFGPSRLVRGGHRDARHLQERRPVRARPRAVAVFPRRALLAEGHPRRRRHPRVRDDGGRSTSTSKARRGSAGRSSRRSCSPTAST